MVQQDLRVMMAQTGEEGARVPSVQHGAEGNEMGIAEAVCADQAMEVEEQGGGGEMDGARGNEVGIAEAPAMIQKCKQILGGTYKYANNALNKSN